MDWGSCVEKGIATLGCIPIVFGRVVSYLFVFAGSVAVFMIIFSGILFLLSAGDEKKVETARKTLLFAVVGLLVVFFSGLILNIFADTLGIECIRFFGFNACS